MGSVLCSSTLAKLLMRPWSCTGRFRLQSSGLRRPWKNSTHFLREDARAIRTWTLDIFVFEFVSGSHSCLDEAPRTWQSLHSVYVVSARPVRTWKSGQPPRALRMAVCSGGLRGFLQHVAAFTRTPSSWTSSPGSQENWSSTARVPIKSGRFVDIGI